MGAAIEFAQEGDLEVEPRRRKAGRVDAYLCVDLCSKDEFWTGLTMNISTGGVFVATHAILPPGSLVGIHFELPRHDRRIMTLGEVKWRREYTGDDHVPPGLGIQFIGLDQASLEAIGDFVTAVRERLLFEH